MLGVSTSFAKGKLPKTIHFYFPDLKAELTKYPISLSFEYDASNHLVKLVDSVYHKGTYRVTEYAFDYEDGRVLSITEIQVGNRYRIGKLIYRNDVFFDSGDSNEFDFVDEVIEIEYFENGVEYTGKVLLYLDAKKRPVRGERYDSLNQKLDVEVVWRYDSKGNVVLQEERSYIVLKEVTYLTSVLRRMLEYGDKNGIFKDVVSEPWFWFLFSKNGAMWLYGNNVTRIVTYKAEYGGNTDPIKLDRGVNATFDVDGFPVTQQDVLSSSIYLRIEYY